MLIVKEWAFSRSLIMIGSVMRIKGENGLKITEIVRELISTKISELGYSIYDIEYSKQPEGYVLTVYIDSENGITLEDCEIVSRAVEPLLDEADPIPQSYYLSVSSVGIDRPLKIDADFQRNLGKEVDVKLYSPIDGKKIYCGRLESFDKDSFTLLIAEGKAERLMTIGRKDAAHISPHIDFNKLGV